MKRMTITLLAVMGGLTLAVAHGNAQECEMPLLRVSDAANGEQGNLHAWPGYPSSGGGFVAFESVASNLLPGDDNDDHDVFWRDLETGELLLVSVALDGGFPEPWSGNVCMDCEGYLIAFHSSASDLVEGDTNGWPDQFVRDMELGITERVSVSSSGEEGNGYSGNGRISGNGQYVTFDSWTTNLVPDDVNERRDVFLHDRSTGETILLSVSSAWEQGNGNSYNPGLGFEGRYVAFESVASNLAPSDPNRRADIYVRDTWAETTTHVSKNAFGQTGNGVSQIPDLSGDGRYVAFGSSASNLIPDDTNGRGDVFVVEWQANPPVIERVSVSSEGEQADGSSERPAISSEGRLVVFFSYATNLVPEGASGGGDIYVHDRLTGTTQKVSSSITGGRANGWSIKPRISCDGAFVTFLSSASNLIPADTNGFDDLHLRELEVDWLTSGDGDCDGDIDFADFGLVQQCFTGNAQNAPRIGPECYALDFNFDGHVGLNDVADYLDARTGPQ